MSHRPTSSVSTETDCIEAHSSASSGQRTAGKTAVATPTRSRFARLSATVSPDSRSSGHRTGFGPTPHHRTTPSRSSMRAQHRAISMVPLVPNAERTSGRLAAVPSSPNTILALFVATAVTSATSRTGIEITSRKSTAIRASTSRRRNAACCFSCPRRGRGLDPESPPRR